MANLIEVIEVIEFLYKAQLSYPPQRDTIKDLAQVWNSVFTTVPAPALQQAARDWVATETHFPKLAELRKLTTKVRANNGKSVAGDMFTDLDQPAQQGLAAREDPDLIPGVLHFTADGWTQARRSHYQARAPRIDWDALEQESAEIDRQHPPVEPRTFKSWAEAIAWMDAQRGGD